MMPAAVMTVVSPVVTAMPVPAVVSVMTMVPMVRCRDVDALGVVVSVSPAAVTAAREERRAAQQDRGEDDGSWCGGEGACAHGMPVLSGRLDGVPCG